MNSNKIPGYRTINAPAFRVLVHVLRMADCKEAITIRKLAAAIKWATHGDWVYDSLVTLREAGLVDFKDAKHATIRPTCRAVMFVGHITETCPILSRKSFKAYAGFSPIKLPAPPPKKSTVPGGTAGKRRKKKCSSLHSEQHSEQPATDTASSSLLGSLESLLADLRTE